MQASHSGNGSGTGHTLPGAPLAELIVTLIRARRLLVELVRREVRSRYAGARAGLLWSLINPSVQIAAYSVIFTYVYRARDSSGSVVASLLCGLWPWWGFQEGTTRGMMAIVDQAVLLRRVPVPVEVCVAAAVIASVSLQAIGMILFLVLFAAAGLIQPSVSWFALPGLLLLHIALTASIALCLAPLQVVVRDSIQVVNAFMTIGFFVSPVLYELSALPPAVGFIVRLSPVALLIESFRTTLVGHDIPQVPQTLYITIAAAVLAGVAARLLRRLEGRLDEYW